MYEVGIIGGMGPKASCYMYSLFIEYTKAKTDQDHLKIVILNDSKIPDRTNSIITNNDLVTKNLENCIEELKLLKTKIFIVSCNTAHYFIRKINIKDIIFIDMINCCINYIYKYKQNKNIYLLATNGTYKSNIYKNDLVNISYIEETDLLMDIIFDIKSNGSLELNSIKLKNILKKYNHNSLFILGCTELSLLKDNLEEFDVIDSIDIVVLEVIKKAGYVIKEDVLKKYYEGDFYGF